MIQTDSMTSGAKLKKAMATAWGPTLAVLFVLAMLGYAIFGPTGLYAWGDYTQSLEVKKAELAKLKKREGILQNRVTLLDPNHVDPDLADEFVRKDLNVVRADEVVIPLK